MKILQEDFEPGDEARCGLLMQSMYGTQDAAGNWERSYTGTLTEDGCEQGIALPTIFHHEKLELDVFVDGDDFFG